MTTHTKDDNLHNILSPTQFTVTVPNIVHLFYIGAYMFKLFFCITFVTCLHQKTDDWFYLNNMNAKYIAADIILSKSIGPCVHNPAMSKHTFSSLLTRGTFSKKCFLCQICNDLMRHMTLRFYLHVIGSFSQHSLRKILHV